MEEIEYFEEFKPIPRVFHSFLTDEPFACCSMCGKPFGEEDAHIVEKSYQGSEVIFEYALCYPCRYQLRDDLSKKSLELVAHFFEERVDVKRRREQLIATFPDHEPWLEACILTGRRRSECESYNIYAECQAGDLIFSYMPFMISSEGMEELEKVLSRKTRDRLDDFVRDVLGLPGDCLGLPKVLV